MTNAEVTTLPNNGDVASWTDAEKAIVQAAGLVFRHTYGDRSGQVEPAPRPVVERFLSLARRTGLDPLAGQIYCIGRLSHGTVEWSIQTGIDGFRVTAEKSKVYAGQDPAQWMTSKGEWVDAFIPSLHGPHPLAARVSVYRSDWPRPSVGVAEWGAYAQTKANGELNAMWTKQGAGQLAKCAEALAHRKAFPQDLSGIYTSDEMGSTPDLAVVEPSGRDWITEIKAAPTHEAIEAIVDLAVAAEEYSDLVRTASLTRHGMLTRSLSPVENTTATGEEPNTEVSTDIPAESDPATAPELDYEAQAAAEAEAGR